MSAPVTAGPRAAETAGQRRDRHDASARTRRRVLLGYVPMVLLAAFFLFPLVFMFVSSLKPDAQILGDIGSPQAFLPVGDISTQNYVDVFDRVPVARFIANSVFVTVTDRRAGPGRQQHGGVRPVAAGVDRAQGAPDGRHRDPHRPLRDDRDPDGLLGLEAADPRPRERRR